MSKFKDNLTSLLNFSLVLLLGSAWAASYYPSMSGYLAVGSIFCTVLISIAVPFLIRRSDRINISQNDDLDIESLYDKLLDKNSLSVESTLIDSDRLEDWQRILQKWHDPHQHNGSKDKIIKEIFKKVVSDEIYGHYSNNSTINIGAINLVIHNNTTSIRMANNPNTANKIRDEKINVILRPDLELR